VNAHQLSAALKKAFESIREEPVLTRMRLNPGQYRTLKAIIFVELYSRKPKPDGYAFSDIKIEVVEGLTEAEYFDQYGNKMVIK
jgi:hypothetical protein